MENMQGTVFVVLLGAKGEIIKVCLLVTESVDLSEITFLLFSSYFSSS